MRAPPFAKARDRSKYTPGEGFATVGELVDYIVAGGLIYPFVGALRPLAPGWTRSLQLNYLIRLAPTARRAIERQK